MKFSWTRWLLNESNENFCNDDSALGIFGEALVRLKKPSREKFCKLWQIYMDLTVHNTSGPGNPGGPWDPEVVRIPGVPGVSEVPVVP